jgi:O-antigen biosynthesis protein
MTGPSISYVVPVGAARPAELAATLASLEHQRGDGAEVVAVTSPGHGLEVRAELLAAGRRGVRVVHADGHLPAAAMQAGLVAATADHVAVVAPGDHLEPHATAVLVDAIASAPEPPVLVYTDQVRHDAGLREPVVKPTWSPERCRCQDVVGDLALLARGRLLEVGGFDVAATGAERYDAVLRVTEGGGPVVHVPVGLHHLGPGRPPAATDGRRAAARRRVAAEHLGRLGIAAEVVPSDHPAVHRLVPPVPTHTAVDVIVIGDASGSAEELHAAAAAWVGGAGVGAVVLVHPEPLDLSSTAGTAGVTTVAVPPRTSLGRAVGAALDTGAAPAVAVVDPGTRPADPAWSAAVAHHLSDPAVGVVGCPVADHDGCWVQAGVVLARARPWRELAGCPVAETGHLAAAATPRRQVGSVAPGIVVRRTLLDQLGGLDPDLPAGAAEVDLCLRAAAAGSTTVLEPAALLVRTGPPLPAEVPGHGALLDRWGAALHVDHHHLPGLRPPPTCGDHVVAPALDEPAPSAGPR